jgi:hypothetical protein
VDGSGLSLGLINLSDYPTSLLLKLKAHKKDFMGESTKKD